MIWHKLPFSHGLEVENHLVNEIGEVVTGDFLVETWKNLFTEAFDLLKKEIESAPEIIKKKIIKIETEHDVNRQDKSLSYHAVTYRLGKEKIKVYMFGPDPNISQITWLLELVTPPCEYIEELDWWITTLYKICQLPEGIFILPLGMSPAETGFRSGLSAGEHHHIGIPKDLVIQVYNCFRAFVPHLICITANSTLLNFSPTGNVRISATKDGYKRVVANNCVRSLRLQFNTTQMGPNSTLYLPYLADKSTRENFSDYVKKPIPDDKYVDIFPFTDYGTIELRFFDALFANSIRLALVAILQCLALKTQRLVTDEKTTIPDVESKTLFENRRKAIELGFLGRFQVSEKVTPNPSDPFWRCYLWDPESGQTHTKLFQACRSMLFFIKEELLELKLLPIVNRVLAFLWGTEEPDKRAAPFSLTDLILENASKRSVSKSDLIKSFHFPGSSYLVKGTKLSPAAKEFLLAEPAEPVLVTLPPKKRLTQITPTPIPTKTKKKKIRKTKPKKEEVKTKKSKKEPIPKKIPKKVKKEVKKESRDPIPKKPAKKKVKPPKVSISKEEEPIKAIPIPDVSTSHQDTRDARIAEAMTKRKVKPSKKITSLPVEEKKVDIKSQIMFMEPKPKKVNINFPKEKFSGKQFWIPTVEWNPKDVNVIEQGTFEIKTKIKSDERVENFVGKWETIQPTSENPTITLPILIDMDKLVEKDSKLKIKLEATYEGQIIFQEEMSHKFKVQEPFTRIAKVAYEKLHGFTKVSYFLESDGKAKPQLNTILVTPYLQQTLIDETIEFKEKQSVKLDRNIYIPPKVLIGPYWLITKLIGKKEGQDTNYRRVVPPVMKILEFNVDLTPQGGKKNPYSKLDLQVIMKAQTSLVEPQFRLIRVDPTKGPEVLEQLRLKEILKAGDKITLSKKKWKPPKGLLKIDLILEVEDHLGLIPAILLESRKSVNIPQ